MSKSSDPSITTTTKGKSNNNLSSTDSSTSSTTSPTISNHTVSTNTDSKDTTHTKPPSRKKRRTLGTFPCLHCNKIFSRSDHLARHNLNHEPKEVFKCDFLIEDYSGNKKLCGKTFVRRDLKERHIRRHLEILDAKPLDPALIKEYEKNLQLKHEHDDELDENDDDIENEEKDHPITATTKKRKSVSKSINQSNGYLPTSSINSPSQTNGHLLQISNLIHENEDNKNIDSSLTKKSITTTSPMTNKTTNQSSSSPFNLLPIQDFSTTTTNIPTSYPLYNTNIPTPNMTSMVLPQTSSQLSMTQQQINNPPQPSISQQQSQTNLSDFYNQPLINFTKNLPQTQNDILSWLFNENAAGSSTSSLISGASSSRANDGIANNNSNPMINAATAAMQNMILPPQNQFQSPQNALQNPMGELNNNDNGNIPNTGISPFPPNPNVQFSPLNDQQLQNLANAMLAQSIPPQPQQQQQQQPTQIQPNSRSNSLQNYSGIQDNLFQNDDNPLDEVFIRNYQSLNTLNGGAGGLANVNNFAIPDTTYMNLNMTSTASSSSPTNTNESNTSPKTLSDFHFATKLDTYELKLLNHAEKSNMEKNKHIFIDTLILESILRCLKTVDRESIEEIFKNYDHDKVTIEDRLSYYLHMYWLVFHPQFSIIHKPSFNTKVTQPLLLISMIVIGCHYSSPELDELMAKKLMQSPEYKFSTLITTPLRYMIFQHEDFKSPVKLWILQSLNMIEWVEKNFLSRRMHERAHLHHGTTVQLLRRSPLLGGNPTVNMKKSASSTSGSNSSAGEDESEEAVVNELNGAFDSTDSELFLRWVESESMKRVTFLTFYLDTIDYVKFRHPPQIMFYQLQLLNLPCDDDCLWESNDVNESFKKVVKKQRKLQQQQKHDDDNNTNKNIVKIRNGESFLNVLKKLLKPYKPRETLLKMNLSRFSKKILLAGLVAIMYQMQQIDLQSSSSLLTSNGIIQTNAHRSKIWKEIILKAFDNWHFELLASFTNTPLSVTDKVFKDVDSNLIPSPMLHLSQIIGFSDINHYDIAIFGGSPANMSVNATMKDHYIVQRKLNNIWGKSVVNNVNNSLNANATSPTIVTKKSINEIINIRGVIHCYLLLWHLMLKPLEDDDDDCCNMKAEFIDWKACPDYFDSMYAVSIATLVLWSYVFSTLGLESSKFNQLQTDDEKILHSKNYEDIVHLSAEGGYEYLSRIREDYITHLKQLKSKYTPHEILNKYGDILPLIANKQNISGLCFLVGTRLLCSQWQVIRENAKLILNCGYRSIGKKNILCLDLFDNEFSE
ncbi:C2H2 zinc finger protein [Scheffersomyces coipomensis]|uniref:C2H2 zinc finger protein n=1 Tax=Scheffersomyces coipomensis TaxID=1788519 RepID=UPI00315DD753